MTQIYKSASLTMQVEKRCVSQSGSWMAPCVEQPGKQVKIADPTASPRYEGLQSIVGFFAATGLLQKDLKPAFLKSLAQSFWTTQVALVFQKQPTDQP